LFLADKHAVGGAVYRSANLQTDTFSQASAAEKLDKAAAIAAYARQRKDVEVDVWMTEIRRRAEIRIGELSRDLDKAQRIGPTGEYRLPTGGKSKIDALLDAGISTSTAHRYEELTGGADARGEAAAKRAIEETLAKGRVERTPVSAKELRLAIKEALPPYFGPQPRVRQPSRGIVSVALSGVQNSAHPLTSAPSYSRTIRPPEQ